MTTSAAVELRLAGDDRTVELGRRVGSALAPLRGGVIALSGHLGAGKTTFVKGLAESLGVAEARDVVSPTFVRVVTFDPAEGGGPRLVHADAYRMKGAEDLVELGLAEDLAGGAVCAIEWPEIVESGLPEDRLRIAIEHIATGEGGESARIVRIESGGPQSAAWLARIVTAGLA